MPAKASVPQRPFHRALVSLRSSIFHPTRLSPATRLHTQGCFLSGECPPPLGAEIQALRQQSAYSPWFAGSQKSPARADHFVLVRYVRLYEQTTAPSRTVLFAGASPDFIRPTPLSIRLLITIFSVQFQEFQALQALGSSCSHNALAGNYTLLLQVTRETDRCDPGHLALLCIPLDRFLPVLCMPAVYDDFAPRLALPDYVCAFCRASALLWEAGGTPTGRLHCHLTYQELASTDKVGGHRLAPH
jgi:hypothetical protein